MPPRIPTQFSHRTASGFVHRGVVLLCAASLWGAVAPALAQTAAPTAATPVISLPNWQELTPQQRDSLQPLSGSWNAMADGHKRKWLAMAQNYDHMGAPEREKLHARMAEWSALKPKEREQARLNYAETRKKIPASERAANWEAYQALSPEEKQELASKAKRKPGGAAVAVKPVPKDKLASVPVTRRTPEEAKASRNAKKAIDRNTLLPLAQRPAATPQPAEQPPVNK